MSLPKQVGVYGGGRMGAGIAHAFLVSGASVTVVESSDETAAAARGRIEDSLAKAKDRGSLEESPDAVLARLTLTTVAGELGTCDLVVEAVPEHVPLKQQVLARGRGGRAGRLARHQHELAVSGPARKRARATGEVHRLALLQSRAGLAARGDRGRRGYLART